jgi:hypothetical protein
LQAGELLLFHFFFRLGEDLGFEGLLVPQQMPEYT